MEIFKFEKDSIESHIRYELKLFSKIKEPLNYIFKTLENTGHSITLKSLDKINLKKVKEREGKNYNWSVINYKNVQLLIRTYKQHLTIFTKVTKPCEYKKGKMVAEFGAFTFHTDMEFFKGTDKEHDRKLDEFYENPLVDLNKCAKQLFEVLIERGVSWVWNSACWKTPEYVKIKLAFEKESIHSIDNLVFCFEEINYLYCELFAENTMFKTLPKLEKRIGEEFDYQYNIKEVHTTLKNGYYHDVGVLLQDKKDKKKTSFQDVYSLTRYYFEKVFKEKTYSYKGEIYVEGGEFKIGEPVAYKDETINKVTLFEKTFPKENFIPLKKY